MMPILLQCSENLCDEMLLQIFGKFVSNFFVKYANNYCIIGDVTCINMHHLTADDKALILTLQVEKHCNVDKMILEFPNNS